MNKIEYYTDGACSGNPGPGGFAVVRLDKHRHKEDKDKFLYILKWDSNYFEETTNNRMELMAIISAIESVLDVDKEDFRFFDKFTKFIINSDSAYCVNICNDWIWKWADNGWKRAKGKLIENLDLIIELYVLLNQLKERNIDYKIQKCAGHAGILENELADALASRNENKFQKLVKDNNILLYF